MMGLTDRICSELSLLPSRKAAERLYGGQQVER
jgi:hypothetical protein